MKEKISGVISLIGSIGFTLFMLYNFYTIPTVFKDKTSLWLAGALIVVFISTILYVLWTRFGSGKLNKLARENQQLKQQIENKELKKQLEESE